MDFGKVTTCAHCGRQFKALLEKHDEQDCIDGLLAENERLRQQVKELEHESADRAELIDNLLEQKESCQKCIEKALYNKKRAEAAEDKLARCMEAGNHLQHEARLVAIPGRGHLIDAIEMWTSAALAAANGGA